MSLRRLSVAVGDYMHVRDLADGRVRVPGLDLVFVQLPIEEVLQRAFRFEEWDVAELSLAQYVATRSQGDGRFIAIPVFPSRTFRHGSIFVRQGAQFQPQDLAGTRVGVPEWGQTAGVWARGLLADAYGVDARSIHWVQAGLQQPGREEGISVPRPAGISLTTRRDATLGEMLVAGEIEAVISARPPRQLKEQTVRRLFSDVQEVETAWARATGVFPIMHVIVLRHEVYEGDRWIAQSLLHGFAEAKRRAIDAIADPTLSVVPIPWASEHLARATELLCGNEWWPYGVEPNRRTLEAFLSYSRAQGIAGAGITVDSLFAEETLGTVRV